jgi:hypothetical protein
MALEDGAGFTNTPRGLPRVDPTQLDADTDGVYQNGQEWNLGIDNYELLNDNQDIAYDAETNTWRVKPSPNKALANEILKNDQANERRKIEQERAEEFKQLQQQDSGYFSETRQIQPSGSDKEMIFSYPYDLGLIPELKNWISFEIFVSGGNNLKTNTDSKSDANPRVYGIDIKKLSGVPGVNPEKISNILNSPAGVAGTVSLLGLQAGSLATSGIGAQVAKDLWNNFSYEGSDKVGAGEFGFVQETTGMTTANQRVPRTICLYMPSNLKTSYGVEYNEEDFTKLGVVTETMKVTAQTLAALLRSRGVNDENLASQIRVTMEHFGRQALKSSSDYLNQMTQNLGGELGGQLNLANYYRAISRKVTNPFIINMYKSTKRRTFEFSFKFLPRNAKEVETAYQIINLFKRYSLPKRIGGLQGRYVEFPAEFKIRFNHDGMENLYLPRIGRCALTDINVSYGDDPFSTFAPVSTQTDRGEIVGGAAPTKIEMSLVFSELEILTADRIDQGF